VALKMPKVWCADLVYSVLPCAEMKEAVSAAAADYPVKNEMWDAATSTIRLSGAANEVISFQLVVERRAGALESLELSGAGAVKPELAAFANIALTVGENKPCDDPLCPMDPAQMAEPPKELAKLLRVAGRARQTWTVELYIPRGSPAGRHEMELALGLKGEKLKLKLALTVFGFELPDEPACTADMNAYGVSIGRGWEGLDPASDRYMTIEKDFFRICHDHRAIFHLLPYAHSGRIEGVFAPVLEGRGRSRRVKDWTPFDRRWGALLDGSAFAGTRRGATPIGYLYLPINLNWPAYFEKYGTPGYELEFKNVVREFATHFAEKGWTRTKFEVFFNHKVRWKYFPWDMDEIRYEKDNKATLHLAKLANEAVAGVPGVQFVNRVDSSWIFGKSARSELGDVIDLWIVNGSYCAPFPDEAELLKKKGQEVWYYGGAGHIVGPTRLFNLQWPWITWGRGLDGFTWWCANCWPADPWGRPGSGHDYCLYPGARLGLDAALPSLRLKALQRGMQDHAYLVELSRRTGSRAAADAILKDRLGCARGREDWWQRGEYPGLPGSDTRSNHKFTPRPWQGISVAGWGAAREALGAAIEKAGQGKV
jgi:hypothetical protein